MSSLYLNPRTWDLVADVNGNIALAGPPYSDAQDAACQIKLWRGELYYDTSQGVPWWNVYGELPPLNYVRTQLENAALLVPDVVSARVLFSSFTSRIISGQVQINDGEAAASF